MSEIDAAHTLVAPTSLSKLVERTTKVCGSMRPNLSHLVGRRAEEPEGGQRDRVASKRPEGLPMGQGEKGQIAAIGQL